MQRRLFLLALLAACFALQSAEEAPKPEQFVEELGSTDFDARAAAAEKLEALGDAARAALEKALTAKDAETRDTARALLQKLKQASLVCVAFDRDGKPAAGAVAKFAESAGTCHIEDPPPIDLKFDERGSVRVGRFNPGRRRVNVSFEKFSELSGPSEMNLCPGPNLAFYVVTRGATVTGRVVDQDGKGIAGAQVSLTYGEATQADLDALMRQRDDAPTLTENFASTLTATTDADGNFRLENVTDGIYQCLASAADCFNWAGPLIRAREGATIALPAAVLRPCQRGAVAMELLDAKGAPVKDRTVHWSLTPVLDPGPVKTRQPFPHHLVNPFEQESLPAVDLGEDGKLTIEKRVAGTYDLLLKLYDTEGDDFDGELHRSAQCVEYERRGIAVKAGETLDLGKLQPVKGGTVMGKILSRRGKARPDAIVQAVPDKDLPALSFVLSEEGAFDVSRVSGLRVASVNAKGAYTFNNLRPGRYTFLVWTDTCHEAVIYGVECVEGKETHAPVVKLASESGANPDEITGVVQSAEGKPLFGAQLTLHFSGGSWGTQCDQQGNFSFSSIQDPPLYLITKVPGMRPERIDLAAGIPQQPLVIHVRKREYGALRVKVVDEQGNPVRDARVWPVSRDTLERHNANNQRQRMKRTGAGGEVEFTGLADGPREFIVEHDDCFPKTPPRVVITPETQSVVVAMRSRLQLRGRVEFPAGAKPPFAGVEASCSGFGADLHASVNDDGTFCLNGLLPGEYEFCPSAPGLAAVENQKFILKDGEPTPVPVLKMVRCGAAALRFDPAARNKNVGIVSYEKTVSAEARMGDVSTYEASSATTDADGRAEYFGNAPGKYRVLRWSDFSDDSGLQGTSMSVVRYCGTLEVLPAPPVADLAKMEAVTLKFPEDRGSVRFQVVLKPTTLIKNARFSLSMFISGEDAYAETYQYDTRLPSDRRDMVVIGTPPAGAKPVTGPGHYYASDLPDGEYTLLISSVWRNPPGEEDAAPAMTPVKTFTIKNGAAVDLGTVEYVPPPPPKNPAAAITVVDELPESDDKLPGFQP